jgi:hypothetical protein
MRDQRSAAEPGGLGRRDFVRAGAAAGLGAALAPALGCGPAPYGQGPAPQQAAPLFAAPPLERVRMGFVGIGGMGSVHLANYLQLEGVEVKAVCDVAPSHAARARQRVVQARQPEPAVYDRGPRDFERMCGEQELDLVLTATPWEWHVPVCLAALRTGKHAATEVPAALTLDECWQLVEAAERYRKHCVMLENCCYDRRELLMLNLVRQGIFGELLHGEGSYQHDLRGVKFSTDGEGLWRRAHATRRNGNLYPTHSRGLQLWQREHLAADDPRRTETYVLGDINLTLIQTARGQTIYLVHDTNSPRPYSRINAIQGTRGLMQGWPDRIYVEGRSAREDAWEPLDTWFERYEHPLWTSERVRTASGGHGGMDFLEDWRLITCLRAGLPTDWDVYDAAAWSCVSELTERSVASRSRSMDVPDFTRGAWRARPPLGIVEA